MNDLISRQAAIDIERNATVDTNPSHFEAHQKFTQFMDDAEISSFGRWQWSNGFNTALTAVGIDLKKLPTVDAEPVRHGHWIEGNNFHWYSNSCSCCGYTRTTDIKSNGWNQWKYCPNCGAAMREVDE